MASVNSTHRDYDRFATKWHRARDVICGQDAMHAAGERYLPKLKDESDADYKARLKRSDFFNGTWRTIDGLTGMAFRKPPVVELPTAIEGMAADINLAGMTLDTLAGETVEEVLSVGRIGLLVDHPPLPENVKMLSKAAAEKRGERPTIKVYPAESIINWKFGRLGNKWALAMVVLKEAEFVPDGEFAEKQEDRYRVLDLDASGQYRQRVFAVVDGKDVQICNDVYPLMNGNPLAYIPFTFVGAGGRADEIDEPPLIDLIDKNVAHYQVNADYRHGLHFTGLPTAIVSGYVPESSGEKLYIGSQAAWVFPDPGAKASFLEFTGQGLGAIQGALDRIEKQMALLGARMIADESQQAETLGATQIKRSGENSVLSRIVSNVSQALEWALTIFAEWAGAPGEVKYQINRDFNPTMMDAQQLTALVGAVQAGEVSSRELFDLLQRGDLIAPDKTFEEHQEEVQSQGPAMPAPVNPGLAA